MKKSRIVLLTLLAGLAILLGACVPGPRVVGTPGISVSEDKVFVAYRNFVYGLNAETGTVAWFYPEKADTQVVFYAQPLVTDDFVYIGDLANDFHKLDIDSGDAVWTFSGAEGFYIGQAAEDEGIIYAPSSDGNLYALNENGDLLWKFTTDHYIWAQPQISADAIFVASMDHKVYAVSKDGEELWSKEIGAAMVAKPLLSADGSKLYIGSIGKEMLALDTEDGETLWSFNAGGAMDGVWGDPILVENTLYFADSQGQVYALDAQTGDQIWQTTFDGTVVGGLTAIEDGFVLVTEEGVVKSFDFDGSPGWEATLDGEIFQAPATNGEMLIVGTIEGDKLVYAFNMTGVQIWSTTPEN